MLRSCYRTWIRLFPGGRRIPVQWYFVPQGTEFIPFPTVFGSINWTERDIQPDSPIGEDHLAPRQWVNGRPPPGICRTGVPRGTPEQWMTGCEEDDRPACIPGDTRGPGPYSCEYSTEYA